MKIKTLAITVAILAVLSVAAYLANRPEAPAPADPRVGKALLGPDTVAKASTLSVSDQGKRVDLAKQPDGSWRVASYYDMPADFDKVARLVQDLNEAKVDRFVTSSPERLARMGFADSSIVLGDASGKEIWSVTFGRTPESGNGKFVRFGREPMAFFSGLHVWLDTDARGWADAKLVSLKPEDVASVEIPFDGGAAVVASREKKDSAWSAKAPAGRKLLPDRVASLVSTLTTIRFNDTTAVDDPLALAASPHMRAFKLTSFDGRALTVALGRKPEEKKPKPIKAAPAPAEAKAPAPAEAKAPAPKDEAKPAPAKEEAKAPEPEFETIPAGPVFVSVSSSDPHAPVNDLMKRRSFEVDDYTFTGLPQKPDELFEAEKAK
jgi:hypothetical protein